VPIAAPFTAATAAAQEAAAKAAAAAPAAAAPAVAPVVAAVAPTLRPGGLRPGASLRPGGGYVISLSNSAHACSCMHSSALQTLYCYSNQCPCA
jgi:hypothetical protein